MTEAPLSRLCVVGLGLLGGSLARGARARGMAREIVAVGRTPATLARAQAEGVIDNGTHDLAEGVRDADLVVLCTPVGLLPGLVRAAWPHLGRGAVLTDVGSVKDPVVQAADGCDPRDGTAFVGSHPMAGSERSGFDAADADLFEGHLTLLTPTARTPGFALARVTAFWERLGSHVRQLAPDAHDQSVATISHLVHLAAFGLVAAAGEETLPLSGPGFADTTRIAASSEGFWTDVFRENRAALLESVARYREVLSRWEALVRDGRWEALEAELARARSLREKLG